MPYVLQLTQALKQAGWKVKIHDSERLEPPHVTIYRKFDEKWRLCLRDGTFRERGHKWSQIDKGVRQAIEDNWDLLIAEWDAIHPNNPVIGDDDE